MSSPLVKITIPFAFGIFFGIYFPFFESRASICISIFLLGLISFSTFYPTKIRIFWNNSVSYSLLLFCLFSLSGYNYSIYKNALSDKDLISDYLEDVNLCELLIDEIPVEGKNSIKVVALMQKMKNIDGWHKVSGKVILYFQKDSLSINIKYNDRLLLLTSIQEIKPPQNPHEFDYKRYLKSKHILYQGYIRSNEWNCLEKGKANNLFSVASGLREILMRSFKNKNLLEKEAAIASAILLGWDKDIDAETLQSYSSAGITHILSVSGLHVGALCLLVGYLLSFLKTAKQKVVKSILQFIIVWFFALITGMAPPVLRASIMFSFIIAGQIIKHKTNIYNNLSASALFLLLIDPSVITNVGFQLSYAGLLGIVAIQPVLVRFYRSRYKILNYIFELMCVSIAAQLTTSPFTLYYFHQFPTYFLLANVIIVPFSGILLGTALFVALFSWVPFLGDWASLLLSLEIKGMNGCTHIIESLPYSSITDIGFTFIHAVLLVGIVFFLSWAFIKRKTQVLVIGLSCIILFLGYEIGTICVHKKQKKWIVYDLGKKHTVIEFTEGRKAFLLGTENFIADKNLQKFHIGNNQALNRIKQIKRLSLSDSSGIKSGLFFKNQNFIQFGQDKIVLINKESDRYKSRYILKVNYMILYENPRINIRELTNRFRFDTLIIASSNSNTNIEKWIRECNDLKILYISINSEKAFVRDLN